jgi:hypothetical protein
VCAFLLPVSPDSHQSRAILPGSVYQLLTMMFRTGTFALPQSAQLPLTPTPNAGGERPIAPLIREHAVTRRSMAVQSGDERAGAKSVEATRAVLAAH